MNRSLSNISFASPRKFKDNSILSKNDISEKNHTIQLDIQSPNIQYFNSNSNNIFNNTSSNNKPNNTEDYNMNAYNNSNSSFIKKGNNTVLQNTYNPQQVNKSYSKSHSADNFYAVNKLNNKSFQNNNINNKKIYTFKNINYDTKSPNNTSLNYINNNDNSIFKYQDSFCSSNNNANKLKKNTKFQESMNDLEESKNDKIDLSGLFYNERFSHNKKDLKQLNKSSIDTIEHENRNINRSSSCNNILNKDELRKIENINNTGKNLSNSIFKNKVPDSKLLHSFNNNKNIYNNNNSQEFSKDSLNNLSNIINQTDNHNNLYNVNNNNINENNLIFNRSIKNDKVLLSQKYEDNKNVEIFNGSNKDKSFNNKFQNRNPMHHNNMNKIRDSRAGSNYNSIEAESHIKNSTNNNIKNLNENEMEKNNNNIQYNLIYEKQNSLKNKENKGNENPAGKVSNNYGNQYDMNLNNKKSSDIDRRMPYKAFLKKDFIIESLKTKISKGEIIDIVIASETKDNKKININEGNEFNENISRNKSISNCFVIYNGNQYHIPKDYIDVYSE